MSGLKKSWKVVAIIFTISVLLFSIPAYYSIQPEYSNTLIMNSGNHQIKIYPENITIGSFQSSSGEIKFQVDSKTAGNYTIDVLALIYKDNQWVQVYNSTVYGNLYFQFSTELPLQYIANGTITLEVQINGVSSSPVHLFVKQTDLPYILEAMFYSSLALAFFVSAVAVYSRKILLLPVALMYSIISVLIGQRYDLFFMISSGLRLLHGVDPYIASAQLPGPLKWAYPPAFPYYSELVDRLIFTFYPGRVPSNASLNYIGVMYGNLYSAWKGIKSLPLYELYAAIKIPMLLSVFGSYFLLWKMSQLKGRNFGLWLLNPAVILIGIAWGQIDAVAAFCMLMSIYYFRKSRTSYSVLMASIGTIIKIFPVLLIPFIIISSKHRARDALIVLAIGSLALLLYYSAGNFSMNVATLFYSRTSPTFNGLFFVNGLSWQFVLQFLKIVRFPSLFLYVFVPAYAILVGIYWKTRKNLESFLIVSFLLFFLTYNIVNPQYMIYPVALYLILGRPKEAIILSIISVAYVSISSSLSFFLNPELSYNYLSSLFGQSQDFLFTSIYGKIALYGIIFLSNAVFLYLIIREGVLYRNTAKPARLKNPEMGNV